MPVPKVKRLTSINIFFCLTNIDRFDNCQYSSPNNISIMYTYILYNIYLINKYNFVYIILN